MYVVMVRIKVNPLRVNEFLSEMLLNSKGSLENEEGCFQFDVCQDISESNRIYLYEVYKDESAFQVHLGTPHYLRWRESVKDLLQEPSVSRRCFQVSQ